LEVFTKPAKAVLLLNRFVMVVCCAATGTSMAESIQRVIRNAKSFFIDHSPFQGAG
jgi:hypothetical protein